MLPSASGAIDAIALTRCGCLITMPQCPAERGARQKQRFHRAHCAPSDSSPGRAPAASAGANQDFLFGLPEQISRACAEGGPLSIGPAGHTFDCAGQSARTAAAHHQDRPDVVLSQTDRQPPRVEADSRGLHSSTSIGHFSGLRKKKKTKKRKARQHRSSGFPQRLGRADLSPGKTFPVWGNHPRPDPRGRLTDLGPTWTEMGAVAVRQLGPPRISFRDCPR